MGKWKSKSKSKATDSVQIIVKKLRVKNINSDEALRNLLDGDFIRLKHEVVNLKKCFQRMCLEDNKDELEGIIDDFIYFESDKDFQSILKDLFNGNLFLDQCTTEITPRVNALILKTQQLSAIIKAALDSCNKEEKKQSLESKQRDLSQEFFNIHCYLEDIEGQLGSFRGVILEAIEQMVADQKLREHMITLSQTDTPLGQWLYDQLLERGMDVNPQLSQISESMEKATLGT